MRTLPIAVLTAVLFACSACSEISARVDAGSVEAADGGPKPFADASLPDHPDAGSAADAGTSVAVDSGTTSACLGSDLLAHLGKDHVLAGFAGDDDLQSQAPWDLQYKYLSGGVPDGAGPCASCLTNCTTGGSSCDNAHSCGWWGCWQWDQEPPGKYVGNFAAAGGAPKYGILPMVTYYEILQASGAAEGAGEVAAVNNQAFMSRLLADWRFVLQQVGNQKALLHIEPDFWGYCEHANADPHATPAAVASANPSDCGGQENSIAGLGRCMIAMVRKYAPNARVGLHGSAWGTKIDVLGNSDPQLDVAGEAKKLGQFLKACGADQSDFVVVDASDRDAGYYQSIGRQSWWDATNATLPNFHQAFDWAKALAEEVGKPIVWWQVPVGNMSQSDTNDHWKDNRVDYFFAHADEIAAAHGVAMAFGAGMGGMTTPSTDGGNLIAKVKAYEAAGGAKLCR
ncbi:MAG: hypothetical protein QM765_19230 [Myxococcales bacterium]